VGANDYAIIIAVEDYDDLPHFRVGEDAIRAFTDWLIRAGGVPALNIAKPDGSRDSIATAFGQILSRVKGDRLYIYMTGYAVVADGLFFLPEDVSSTQHEAIRVDELTDIARATFDEVVVIADCEEIETGYTVVPWAFEGTGHVERYAEYFRAFSLMAVPFFTQKVTAALRGRAAGPDGAVTALSLAKYLRDPKVQLDVSSDFVIVPPRKEEPPPLTPTDRVSAHADDPAVVDELGRRPFAEVIGKRIEEVRALQEKRQSDLTFMIHIHGPWGSGKTSVLNFLKAYLQQRKWVVVEFNAWRHQRMRPPWWALIRAIYGCGWRANVTLAPRWWLWRFRADVVPALITVGLLGIVFWLVYSVLATSPTDAAKNAELAPKVLTAIAAAAGALWASSRSLVFGSARAAQTYTELRSDPLGPIITLFTKMIRAIKRPVVVFIDDLDRCDAKYVIELLEGIQTLFRSAPVTYVVAADRKWICSSFDQTYEHFGKTIGEPGRPLGYLFLEKVFQVSASVPRLSAEIQREYWRGLLRGDASIDPRTLEEERKAAEVNAAQAVKGAKTQEELDAKIAAEERPLEKAAMRAAAAKQIVSEEARKETEHRLQPFAGLLEPNPRAMKRLVNAYGLHQAANFLEGRNVVPEVLARWTIVELRWPLLADYFAAHPEAVALLTAGSDVSAIPEGLQPLFGDAEVRAAAGYSDGGANALDEAAVRSIIGR